MLNVSTGCLLENKQLPREYQEYFNNLDYSQMPDKLIEISLKEQRHFAKRGIKSIKDLKRYAVKDFKDPFLLRDSNQLNSFFSNN
jgi:predicted NACHT family NTPase